MTGREHHDNGCRTLLRLLLRNGCRVATEVGVMHGRIDVAVLNKHDEPVWLFEVKARNHESGIPQLLDYAEKQGGVQRLTLVVEPGASEPGLFAAGAAEAVEVWELPFVAVGPFEERFIGKWIFLPYIHPDVVAEVIQRRRLERVADGVAA